jgi:hypothetical protein
MAVRVLRWALMIPGAAFWVVFVVALVGDHWLAVIHWVTMIWAVVTFVIWARNRLRSVHRTQEAES